MHLCSISSGQNGTKWAGIGLWTGQGKGEWKCGGRWQPIGQRSLLCLSIRYLRPTKLIDSWHYSFILPSHTPPSFYSWTDRGAMVIQAEKCQNPDSVQKPSVHPSISPSLLWRTGLPQFSSRTEQKHAERGGWRDLMGLWAPILEGSINLKMLQKYIIETHQA